MSGFFVFQVETMPNPKKPRSICFRQDCPNETKRPADTIPLQLDHVDGNWANNRPENLRLLCPNHHALTATYGYLRVTESW